MPTQNSTQYLQKCIVMCSALGILLVGVIVGAASIVPLYDHLRKVQESQLTVSLASKMRLLEEYFAKARDIASQQAIQMGARQELNDYNNGRISLSELIESTRHEITDAMHYSRGVSGITRLDGNGNPVVQFGPRLPVPPDTLVDPSSSETRFQGPYMVDNDLYLVATNPILDKKRRRIGTDLVLFQLSDLEQTLEDNTGLGKSLKTVLGTVANDHVLKIVPVKGTKDPSSQAVSKRSVIRSAIKKSLTGQNGLMIPGRDHSGNDVIAYGPVRKGRWAIIVTVDKNELYAPVYPHIVTTGAIIGVLTLVGIVVTVLLVRPLTGKMVIRTDELAQQVHEKGRIIEGLYEKIVQSERSKVVAEHTAQVAHELRQPLGIVGGYARRMARQMDSGELVVTKDQRESCRTIISEIKRLENILDGLIDFTRRRSLRLEKVNPHKIIGDVLKAFEGLIEQNGFVLMLLLGEDVEEVPIDPTRFEQVVRNLISNAMEASPRGEAIRIETRILPATEEIQKAQGLEAEAFFEMKIKNHGEMIPAEYLLEIFSPFFTMKESGKGIGLSLSKKIVEDHKGTISVQSDKRETVFTVWLPARYEIVTNNAPD
ncbi:ATP-binding protein [Thermodesulfobacteriota bacterium]